MEYINNLLLSYDWNSSVKCTFHSCFISNSFIYLNSSQSVDIGHPIELIITSVVTFWAFVQIFIFCNLGENVSNRFVEIKDMIYYCDWYTFPNGLQKLLPTIMMSAQEPVIIHGFANLSCTRDSFKKVFFFLSKLNVHFV